ncbi:MAG: hypothetical protein IKF93_01185 [Lachnospiraceae bacterium]|nr:hypothetical protein [Lachnospiraceae bacterium]
MTNFRVRLSYILAALLILGSIFISPNYTSFADESEDPVIIQETEQDAFAEDDFAGDVIEENFTGEDDHSEFSDTMLQAAINRYRKPMLRNVDSGESSDPHKLVGNTSLPYVGEGKVLAIYIDFPNDTMEPQNQSHPEGDTAELLEQSLKELHDYYDRASYGKLNLTGTVLTYSAQKPRGDYVGRYDLLDEALTALDESDPSINFADYDTDGDKLIDCVVMHIPHNFMDGWGSTWWSSCSHPYSLDFWVDGVSYYSNIILSRDLSRTDGLQTLFHETGHAMGFPDYYSYDKEATDDPNYPGLTGTLTFDLMDNNTGDHNGFSKWIAGWLDDDDVIRVHAGADGVYAMRGYETIAEADAGGSITLDLSSFDNDDSYDTGGIIIVNNNSPELFSNYYMLQYDTFAGNEKLYYNYGNAQPLSSGFRVFRVQAELQNGIMIHSNTAGMLFDKLVELVDKDYKEDHDAISYPYAGGSLEKNVPYGCMYYQGDMLTPTTDPSTNFRENINSGFTGIYMKFLESESDHGKVEIWYSEEEKPEEKEFAIELTSAEVIPGGCKVSFEANQQLTLVNRYGLYGMFKGNGAFTYSLRDLNINGNKITGKIYCDPDLMTKDAHFIFRFVQGTFATSDPNGSPQIEIEIPISQDLIELAESGYVEGTEAIRTDYGDPGVHKFSPVYRTEDGEYYFYEYSNTYSVAEPGNTILHKYFFTDDAPGELREELIAGDSEEYTEVIELNHAHLRGDPTENVSILPEGAQLGDYPYVYDAAKVDDTYYVLSFRERRSWSPAAPSGEQDNTFYNAPVMNELALTKLDANGNLIKQLTSIANEFIQDVDAYRVPNVLIQAGPNEKLAVLIFQPSQEYYENHYVNHAATFFYDQDFNFEGRLDNYSTGCGTWLADGRYIAFTQRVMPGSIAELDQRIDRTVLINYDITGVLDPPQEIEYIPEEGADGDTVTWESGSDAGLAFTLHRTPKDSAEISQAHFLGVQVDGNPVTEGKDYTVEFKSVHVTLLPSYLSTLSAGTHMLTILFDDADDVNIPFVIKEAAPSPAPTPGPSPAPGPNTGDATNYTIWIILMAVTLAVIIAAIVLLVHKRKRIRK